MYVEKWFAANEGGTLTRKTYTCITNEVRLCALL